jgi:O-antigen/teichoic acid export membrane protein
MKLGSRARSRLFLRGSSTAAGGYVAAVLGFFTTVVATRELGLDDYARFAAVLAASSFFQQLLDLTIEEALVKYGFRYTETASWGKLRRLFELALAFKMLGGILAGICLIAVAPFAGAFWNVNDVFLPMVIAATISITQAPENVAAGALILHGRYDIRSWFLSVSMGLRLVGLAIGCRHGLVGGVLGMAIAQVFATLAICTAGLLAFLRFPRVGRQAIAEDRAEIKRFFVASTLASSIDSARMTLATTLVPTVAPIQQTAYFRNAQAPATGFAALSGPVRLVMLTEQTRDFEAGRHDRVVGLLRHYIVGAGGLMLVAVPVFWILMPFLMGIAYGEDYRLHAADAARLVLLAAALRLIWGWTKSFPVSIGRPGLRVWIGALEIAVFIPLLLLMADHWGATGAAGAMLISTALFCAVWSVVLLRLRPHLRAPEALTS